MEHHMVVGLGALGWGGIVGGILKVSVALVARRARAMTKLAGQTRSRKMRTSGPPTRGGRKVEIVNQVHGVSVGRRDCNKPCPPPPGYYKNVTVRRGGIVAVEITGGGGPRTVGEGGGGHVGQGAPCDQQE